MVGRSHSDFLATQGMMETLKILSGSTPMRLAKQALATAPNICWGLLAVESRSVHSDNGSLSSAPSRGSSW